MKSLDLVSIRKGLRRARYFAANGLAYIMPDTVYRAWWNLRFNFLPEHLKEEGRQRARFYANLPKRAKLAPFAYHRIKTFKYPYGSTKKLSTYFFDLYQSLRLMEDHGLWFGYIFGDVAFESPSPLFTKTRPISSGPSKNVLMPLNKVRHFMMVKDRKPWREKKDMLVFRNDLHGKPHRQRFLRAVFDNPLCDAGETGADPVIPEMTKPYMPIGRQLDYKFIATLEGNDVATNLKWVMSSQSIAVMPRPKFESWYMESKLEAGVHYIEIADDFSDLDEKLHYYISHPEEAEQIVRNANEWSRRFRNNLLERFTALETARLYFTNAKQHPR